MVLKLQIYSSCYKCDKRSKAPKDSKPVLARLRGAFAFAVRWLFRLLFLLAANIAIAGPVWLSPTALVSSPDGKTVYVACEGAGSVLCFDTGKGTVSGSIAMPEPPSGLTLSTDGETLYVTCAAPESQVCMVNLVKREIANTIPAGHTAMAPVLSPDGKYLYVCNRFNNDVSVIDLASRKELRRIPVQREPFAADITKDGSRLLVANRLPNGRADAAYVAAVVSVIDPAAGKVVKELHLPNGSGSLNDIRVSPDGKYAVVTHLIGRFQKLPTHVTEGWINVRETRGQAATHDSVVQAFRGFGRFFSRFRERRICWLTLVALRIERRSESQSRFTIVRFRMTRAIATFLGSLPLRAGRSRGAIPAASSPSLSKRSASASPCARLSGLAR